MSAAERYGQICQVINGIVFVLIFLAGVCMFWVKTDFHILGKALFAVFWLLFCNFLVQRFLSIPVNLGVKKFMKLDD